VLLSALNVKTGIFSNFFPPFTPKKAQTAKETYIAINGGGEK
jgi:hypothetical protein